MLATMPSRSICVYCSSSDAVEDRYFQAAHELGEGIAARGHALVYGGTDVGLMERLHERRSGRGRRSSG